MERYTPPGGPSSGLKGSILFLEIVYFYFGGMNKKQKSMGAQHSIWLVNEPKKDGCMHARQKPTCDSINVIVVLMLSLSVMIKLV